MRLSVVIPAFNEAKYLPRSLSSLRQAELFLVDRTSDSTEIIVVDNASTDATAAVAQEFGIQVISESRRGIAIARNAGAGLATGEVLVFLDADYRVLPSFLARIAHAYSVESELRAAGVRVALEPWEIDPITRALGYATLATIRALANMSFGVATFRRECFDALGGYDEGVFGVEDLDILERLRKAQPRGRDRYRVLNEILVYGSARGFYRGGRLGLGLMVSTYLRMMLSPASRRDMSRCGYWYERQ
jgi:glycosyltransferase involved in cell wall biosynthesis